VLPKRGTAGARQKDLAVGRPALAVTTAVREEPRSTGRTVAEPDSSVGATGFPRLVRSRGRLAQNDRWSSTRGGWAHRCMRTAIRLLSS
jgi:hypothetical protein